jgi:hypothetical protein
MYKGSSDYNQIAELGDLHRKIAIATEGFTTDRFCELILGIAVLSLFILSSSIY